ncbi:MAG TPA: hypothetical protein VMD97_05845 [Candidatus Aquilonibacter sp.]|nr:hypothetical protein [Candidatus Aquilonibacter sp.]
MKRVVAAVFLMAMTFGMSAASRADTETVTVVFNNPALNDSAGPGYSDPFAQFNPSLGTLASVTLDASASGTTYSTNASNIGFFAGNDVLYCCTDTRNTFSFNIGNTVSSADVLNFFIGTGDVELNVEDGGEDMDATVLNVNSALITYTYTPAATPELGTISLLGTALLGVAGVVGRRLFE